MMLYNLQINCINTKTEVEATAVARAPDGRLIETSQYKVTTTGPDNLSLDCVGEAVAQCLAELLRKMKVRQDQIEDNL